MKRIRKFWNIRKYIEFKEIKDIRIDNEITLSHDRGPGIVDGYYEILNNSFIAIFSFDKKNYLLLNEQLIVLTKDISIRYEIAQEMDKISWFNIYDGEQLIYEIEYINPHEPFVAPSPFPFDEDFFITNFGHELAEYIKQVQENQNQVLFPNQILSDF